MPKELVKAAATVSLAGEEYTVSYRAHAFIRYAEETNGRDLLVDLGAMRELGKQMQSGEPFTASMFMRVRDFLWAGLLHSRPDMTRDEAANLFGLSDLIPLITAISEAIQATMPAPAANGRPIKPRKPKGRVSESINGSDSRRASALSAASTTPNLTV